MSEANLECYTRREDRSPVLSLEGALDIATAQQALDALRRFLAEHGPEIVVDTSRVNFIDSKGAGVLLTAAKDARDAGGCLFLPNPALPVRKILETCGLTSLFPSFPPPFPSRPEAKAAARTGDRLPARATAPARTAARLARKVV